MNVRMHTADLKIALTWVAVFAFRLLPFRPPNVEPLLAALMPLSSRAGKVGSFAFGALSIVLYDVCTAGVGTWTIAPALTYGALGFLGFLYFASREATTWNFVKFGVVGTIAYDLVTGVIVGPLISSQSFAAALAGQIPFTILHLLGTITFAVTLSPALARWVASSEALEIRSPSAYKTSGF
jgi:hypothetical protein